MTTREEARESLAAVHQVIDKNGVRWCRAHSKHDLWVGKDAQASLRYGMANQHPDSYALLWNVGPVYPVGEAVSL
jgi:hypothetical protein